MQMWCTFPHPPGGLCKCHSLYLEHSPWPSSTQGSSSQQLLLVLRSSSQVLVWKAFPRLPSVGSHSNSAHMCAHGQVYLILSAKATYCWTLWTKWYPGDQGRTDLFYGIVVHPFCPRAAWQSPVGPSLHRELDGLMRNMRGCLAQAPEAEHIPTDEPPDCGSQSREGRRSFVEAHGGRK